MPTKKELSFARLIRDTPNCPKDDLRLQSHYYYYYYIPQETSLVTCLLICLMGSIAVIRMDMVIVIFWTPLFTEPKEWDSLEWIG